MDTKVELQNKILSELADYSPKLIMGTYDLIDELKGVKKDDTDDLFGLVIQGINWVIEVFNSCEELINKDNEVIDLQGMSAAVGRLQEVLKEKDDKKIADCLKNDFIPFLESMNAVALEIA